MATPQPAPVRSSSSSQRFRRAAAWLSSLGIHLAVVLIASRAVFIESPTPETPEPPVVVWLEEWALLEPFRPEAPEPEEREIPTESTPAAPEPRSDTEQSRPAGAGEPAADDAEVTETVTETEAPEPEAGEDRPARAFIVREVDWDEVRRRAIEQMNEQLAREGNYRTFALDDVIAKPVPEEPGQPTGEIFAAKSSGGGRALLTPGRSGTPLGRKITALCDVLGGVGIGFNGFSLGTLCAEDEAYDYFADLRPTYMRARPVCTENPGAVAPQVDGPGDPTVKCRLVVEGEDGMPEDVVLEEQAAAPPAEGGSADVGFGAAAPSK